MADQNITNWDAVAKHLAIAIMGWHIDRYFWTDKADNTKMSKSAWKPYEHWGQIGRVIDKMKERHLRCTLITFLAFGAEARFYSNKNERLGHATGQDTPQKAIALAAALATGYVEKEKTEAEILLDKLFQVGLSHVTGIEERILELFEQSFEKVRKEKAGSIRDLLEGIR